MTRPVQNHKMLTEHSIWIQKNLQKEMDYPTLLGISDDFKLGIIGSDKFAEIHLFDLDNKKLVKKLEKPNRLYKGTDYHKFIFGPSNQFVAAYNTRESSFAVWSLKTGKITINEAGDGSIQPAICYLEGGRIAFCDGARVNIHSLEGGLLHYSPLSDDIRSVALFAIGAAKPSLSVIALLRKGLGGFFYHGYRMENSVIVKEGEGPFRSRPKNSEDKKYLQIHEVVSIPEMTQRMLIFLEEERVESLADSSTWEYDDIFTTRLMAFDPGNAAFPQGEIELPGRFCLERVKSEIHLVDQMGRRRLIKGLPLKLELLDWRLEGEAG